MYNREVHGAMRTQNGRTGPEKASREGGEESAGVDSASQKGNRMCEGRGAW